MAQTNVFDKAVRVRPAQGSSGSFNQKDYTVAASTTINYLDIVSLSADGTVIQALTLAASNNTAVTSGGNLPMLGVAMAPIVTASSGAEATTGRTTIPVAVFDANLEVALRIYSATTTATQQPDVVLGTAYQLQRWRGASADEWWYSLITTTTNGELKVTERSPESSVTDNYGIVWLRAAISDTVRQG